MQLRTVLILFSIALLPCATASPKPGKVKENQSFKVNPQTNYEASKVSSKMATYEKDGLFTLQQTAERNGYPEVDAGNQKGKTKLKKNLIPSESRSIKGEKRNSKKNSEYHEVAVDKTPVQPSRAYVQIGNSRRVGKYQQHVVNGKLHQGQRGNFQRQNSENHRVPVHGKLPRENSGKRKKSQYTSLDFTRREESPEDLKGNRRRVFLAGKQKEKIQIQQSQKKSGYDEVLRNGKLQQTSNGNVLTQKGSKEGEYQQHVANGKLHSIQKGNLQRQKSEYHEMAVDKTPTQPPRTHVQIRNSQKAGEYQQAVVNGKLQQTQKGKAHRKKSRKEGEYDEVRIDWKLHRDNSKKRKESEYDNLDFTRPEESPEDLYKNRQRLFFAGQQKRKIQIQQSKKVSGYDEVLADGKRLSGNSGKRSRTRSGSKLQFEETKGESKHDILDFIHPKQGVDIGMENRRLAQNANRGAEINTNTKGKLSKAFSHDPTASSEFGFFESEYDASRSYKSLPRNFVYRSGSNGPSSTVESHYAEIGQRPLSRKGSDDSIYEPINDEHIEHIYEEIPKQLKPPPLPPRNQEKKPTTPKKKWYQISTKKSVKHT